MIVRFLPLLPVSATLGLIFALRGPSIPSIILLFLLPILFYKHFRIVLLFTFLPLVTYYLIGLSAAENQTRLEEGEQELFGTIHSIPDLDGDRLSMRFLTEKNEQVHVQAFLSNPEKKDQAERLSPGDSCRLKGTLTPPNPPTNFNQFDYARYLKEQGIFWVYYIEDNGIECKQHSRSFMMSLQSWRQQQMNRIEAIVDVEVIGIVQALLFGSRTSMDEGVLEAYQRLGVIHLLAVSGLHVGMIVSGLFYAFIRFGLTRERTIDILLIFLPFYIFVAGAAPSVIRASLMTMVVLLCLRLRKRPPPIAGIILVYLAYLSIEPYVLFQLGFQLSFLVSFGLIVSAKKIRTYQSRTIQLLIVTLISQCLSLPILLLHIFEIPWLSLPINLVYIPFITMIILPLTFAGFFLSFVTTTLNLPFMLLDVIIPPMHQVLLLFSNSRFATLVIGKPDVLTIISLYIAMLIGFLGWEGNKKVLIWSSVVISASLISIQMFLPYLNPNAKITMIDVGQGDSFLIELPYRQAVYLIDTGGTPSIFAEEEWRVRRRTFDVGADIVVPALKQRGIRHIDSLVLTHGHADHIGGAKEVAKSFFIETVLYSPGVIEGDLEKEILSQLVKKGAKIKYVEDGFEWNVGVSQFKVLSPSGVINGLNERSIVILAQVEGVSVLFTGDLEEEGEKGLLNRYPNLQVDLLKVGHHGSKTSTTEALLEQLKPKGALISVGRNNHYGHPNPDVLSRLETDNIKVWRSDQDGAVQLELRNGMIKLTKAKK
ncbi:DNA internalization-related competence protein ComEC/Rec2 [Bacillus suaedae]|uniref:DNA internalization-related competence protein ComEC/Rec2 n=1 Tax=Halalkalibacter suaedae TaxID=2822140 RepID=UPI001FF0CBF2|nr:DNA internalization-related competence protein ComEC/Rec2 [Bacillus suaedae]